MSTARKPRNLKPALATVPLFEPHPWIKSGDAQTIAGRFLPARPVRLPSTHHQVEAEAGDRLSVLESIPPGWTTGEPIALLVHGLAGCAQSPFLVRVSARLFRLGVRVVRMNLRGAGSGFGLARGSYHAGKTDDLRWVAEWMAERAPGSPLALVGFSLGANLVLKLAAESSDDPLPGLDCVLAANPPIDLSECCRHIQRPENRRYDKHFLKLLRSEVARLHAAFPELGPIDLADVKTLYEFDDFYTAPRHGFASAQEYYEKSSAGPLIPQIKVDGLVIHAEDDPFIPPAPFRRVVFPAGLALELIPNGGHLGYVSRRCWDGDRRWLDTRLAAWLAARWY
jgi:predicted alpha/beta-fold hydrolase